MTYYTSVLVFLPSYPGLRLFLHRKTTAPNFIFFLPLVRWCYKPRATIAAAPRLPALLWGFDMRHCPLSCPYTLQSFTSNNPPWNACNYYLSRPDTDYGTLPFLFNSFRLKDFIVIDFNEFIYAIVFSLVSN